MGVYRSAATAFHSTRIIWTSKAGVTSVRGPSLLFESIDFRRKSVSHQSPPRFGERHSCPVVSLPRFSQPTLSRTLHPDSAGPAKNVYPKAYRSNFGVLKMASREILGTLSEENRRQVLKFMRFFKSKREGVLQIVGSEFDEAVQILDEDEYTRAEVHGLEQFSN